MVLRQIHTNRGGEVMLPTGKPVEPAETRVSFTHAGSTTLHT